MIKFIINWIIGLFGNRGKRYQILWGKPSEGYLFEPTLTINELVVFCHGGWLTWPAVPKHSVVEYLVNCGYAVFFIRYADEFTKDPMDLDIEKDVDFVSKAFNEFKNKYKKIHLIGASRGGFVTLESAAQLNVFSKIVSICAPTTEASAITLGKLMEQKNVDLWLQYITKWPLPIERAKELSTKPLCIIHGAEDDMVPVSDALSLFQTIFKNYKPTSVSLKVFEDEGHGLSDNKKVLKHIVNFLKD